MLVKAKLRAITGRWDVLDSSSTVLIGRGRLCSANTQCAGFGCVRPAALTLRTRCLYSV